MPDNDLANAVEALTAEISRLTSVVDANKKQIKNLNEVQETQEKVIKQQERENSRSRKMVGTLAVLLILVVLSLGTVFKTSKNTDQFAHDAEQRSLALAVGICAIQNVDRIDQTNVEILRQQYGFSTGNKAKDDEFFAKAKEQLQVVDCKALVPKKDQVNITLNYPTTIPSSTTVKK